MDSTEPPREIGVDTAAEDSLASLISAVKAGKLVALLRGEGLNRRTAMELLKPESIDRLQAILSERVFSERENRDSDRECRPERCRPKEGKLLVFKAKERSRP